MTKDELIALAREGNAHIEIAYTITRYCVTPTADLDDAGNLPQHQ